MLNLNINLKKGFLLRIKKINLFTDGVKNGLLATELMVLFFSNTYKNILKSVLFFFTHCLVIWRIVLLREWVCVCDLGY